jgi:phosphoribosylformylglycinamidine synthase
MKATVIVRLKREVLDPQGDAVRRALSTMGFKDVGDVRIGKIVEIELAPGEHPDLETLKKELAKMSDELLANPVIEDYEVVVK